MSIYLVAKAAKVSPSTVARVINRPQQVRPELVEQVRRGMAEIGYVPPTREKRRGPKSESARTTISRTGNIALLGLGIDRRIMLGVSDTIAKIAEEHGLNLIVAPSTSPDQLPTVVADHKVDGVLLQGLEPTGETATLLKQIPVVWMMTRRSRNLWTDHVEPDNWTNGTLAAEHLLRQGHRQFAVLNPQPNYPAFRIRCDAFEAAIRHEQGQIVRLWEVANDAEPVLHQDALSLSRISQIIAAQIQLLLDTRPRPKALYVPYGSPAAVLFPLLERHGIRVGLDIDVVLGDFDTNLATLFTPPIAQIDVQIPLIARKAIERLAWRIKNPFDTTPIGMSIAPRLMIGNTPA